ncbi:hypothetical protein [Streptomyces qinzhouensis]|uniref:Nucleopolyhedrovirus P10 family protein n=1 Tax=Streptomyces qinzhouensis TaxID=2599401 RepID=A0A5B8J4H9_9ACTN|nr:hypothetical protein [Streptomyces qinzhouensis]QDY76136.1 hypothetical protein FQU76_05915 [Streptomyces qinzhouensis]
MTPADAVRERLALGRLLPLGPADDGTWLTEQAARAVLYRAADRIAGVRLIGSRRGAPGVRLALDDPASAVASPVPPPPGALPHGPLRIDGEVAVERAALARAPLPELAAELRGALLTAAEETLGLVVTGADLRMARLLDTAEPVDRSGPAGPATVPADGPVAEAVAEVPGVAGLTGTLGRPVHRTEDRVRVEFAVAAGHRPLTVVRAVRAAVAPLVAGAPVAVLITAVHTTAGPGN